MPVSWVWVHGFGCGALPWPLSPDQLATLGSLFLIKHLQHQLTITHFPPPKTLNQKRPKLKKNPTCQRSLVDELSRRHLEHSWDLYWCSLLIRWPWSMNVKSHFFSFKSYFFIVCLPPNLFLPPLALSPSLYLDLFSLLSDFVCSPVHAHTHTHTVSAGSFSPSPLLASTGKEPCFPISGPHSVFRHTHTHMHTHFQPLSYTSSALYAPYRILDLHLEVLWQFIFPCSTSESSALSVYSWLCFERSAKLAVPLPEHTHDSAEMWEAWIPAAGQLRSRAERR